jgi:hypothetical protein
MASGKLSPEDKMATSAPVGNFAWAISAAVAYRLTPAIRLVVTAVVA